MQGFARVRRVPRAAVLATAIVLAFTSAGAAIGAGIGIHAVNISTPHSENAVTNLDVLRLELKNYYGDPSGTGVFASNSYYAQEAQHIANLGWNWLSAKSNLKKPMRAIVLDVDDTTLTTWNYELFSNWAFNGTTNGQYVTDELFPATPGMVDLVWKAKGAGYAIFWITGRPDSQHADTLGNLGGNDGVPAPDIDAGYPAPTAVDIGHGGFTDGLFTKPSAAPVNTYPAYLNMPEFCASAILLNASCATIKYKSGTRAYIESLGYDIVADFGDQYSDLIGGYADKVFKMPNPNYYLP
jgi:hypothetical protein